MNLDVIKSHILSQINSLTAKIAVESDLKVRASLIRQQSDLINNLNKLTEEEKFEFEKKKFGLNLAYNKSKSKKDEIRLAKEESLKEKELKLKERELSQKDINLTNENKLENQRRQLEIIKIVATAGIGLLNIVALAGCVFIENKGGLINNKTTKFLKF